MRLCEYCRRVSPVLFSCLMIPPGSTATTVVAQMNVCDLCWWYSVPEKQSALAAYRKERE